MEASTSFGAWLRQRRRALDLTREQLAQRVGCSVSALRKIEADERRPSRHFAERLAECLNIAPQERATFLQVARGERRVERLREASLTATAGYVPPRPTSNLPLSSTPLIGREPELAEIARLLSDPACRLLTLVGPGGIGKTRLAIEAAAAQREAFFEGVYFVSLAPVISAESIVPAIADAIGLTLYGPTDPKAQLLNYLHDAKRTTLLVLDNMEHLLDGVGLLSDILQHAPGVKLLVTSRELLNLQGEWVFEAQGLLYPQRDEVVGFEDYSAVALFFQRARQVHRGFALAAGDHAAVTRICRFVEGMPLGIELAAAWVRTLSCHEIAEEIGRNLDFLAVSARDVPQRHHSIRAAFDHSWNLLSAGEQRVLRQLSVFRGGFRREAAEQVAGASLPVLSTLVDKSLLRHTDVHAGRYDLHELIRQYAEVQLAAHPHEESDTRERHSDYYAEYLAQRKARLEGHEQREALEEIAQEVDNVRAGWRWAVQHLKIANLRKPVRSLYWLYNLRNWYHEGVTLFGLAAEVLGAHDSGVAEQAIARAEALIYQGAFLSRAQLFPARDLLRQALSVLRTAGDRAALADGLVWFGLVSGNMGDYLEASSALNEGLSISREIGDGWNTRLALATLALISQAQGQYAQAQRMMREAVSLSKAAGDQRVAGICLGFLSSMAMAVGEYAEAQALLRESLALATAVRNRWSMANTLHHMSRVAYAQGDYAEAQRSSRESIALFREIGDNMWLAQALNSLGWANQALGAYPEAQSCFREAFHQAMASQTLPNALDALTGIAALLARGGAPESALEALIYILGHPASRQDSKDRAERWRAELAQAAQLSAQQIEAAHVRAQAKTLETVVAEILGA